MPFHLGRINQTSILTLKERAETSVTLVVQGPGTIPTILIHQGRLNNVLCIVDVYLSWHLNISL